MTDAAHSATDKDSLPFSEQHYFSSYDHFGIHEEMLKDQVRTLSYRNAIMKNKDLFKDKIVLDVGCGTGVLSMFAAQAGAKHVIAVDMSNIIEMAGKIADLNGFSDKITFVRGKLEDVKLPYDKVDIIISEWMGYFLLYESMLDTVLWARDHYLKEGGLIFPDRVSMHIAGIEDGEYKEEKIHFWENVYGFDYSPFIDIAMAEPLVDTVDNGHVVTTTGKLTMIDINTVKIEDLAFLSNLTLKATRDDHIHGLVAWFDNWFPSKDKKNEVFFSTGPHAHYTHWKQTVFYLDDVIDIKKGETVNIKLANRPNAINPRELDIEIEWDFKADGDDYRACKGKHNYFLR
ncbi:CYFA0S04e01772g1_1 [Cyberlindnera fabianii]|uniref:type I protein arginine methyltransferase n=1 Tax=Cyberlindnera fabianii TaxID=36022 RepID=A0A061AR65_CYBFA|nr:CYFA0S04e01772g1_1 [Cyberlindnera fabianii]